MGICAEQSGSTHGSVPCGGRGAPAATPGAITPFECGGLSAMHPLPGRRRPTARTGVTGTPAHAPILPTYRQRETTVLNASSRQFLKQDDRLPPLQYLLLPSAGPAFLLFFSP